MRGHSPVLLGTAVVLVIFFLNSHTLSSAYADDKLAARQIAEQAVSRESGSNSFGMLMVPEMEVGKSNEDCPRYSQPIEAQFGDTLDLADGTREEAILQRNKNGAPVNEHFGGTVNGVLLEKDMINVDRIIRHGYSPVEVRNQMYLANPKDLQIKSFADQLENLDAALITYMSLKRRRSHYRDALSKVGPTGRSWGIASAKTNKWRFYHRHMIELRNKLKSKVTICEVGMLAGHSTTLFNIFLEGGKGVADHLVFDLQQPKTPWWKPVTNFLSKTYPHVKISWGYSQVTIPVYREKHPDTRCQYISLDGGKTFPIFNSDMFHFREMVNDTHIILLDDVNPCLVRKGDPRFSSPAEITSIIENAKLKYPTDINSIIAYHIAMGEINLIECFDIDIPGIPFYGNCALTFNLSTKMTIPTSVYNMIKKP